MPKKVIDFQKTVIYTITTGNSLYVGSTTNFTQRKNAHTNSITNDNNANYNFKLYKAIRANDNEWSMLPHSKFPCNDKIEQTIEEERIRCLLNADLNMRSCGTGINYTELGRLEYCKQYYSGNKAKIAEYYTDNKAKIAEQQKQYRTENKAKIAEQKKQYSTENKAKLAEYDKQYRTENKAKLAEYQKQYYTENKAKLAEYDKQYRTENKAKQNQKVICECGCSVSKSNLATHKKTKKHQNWIQSQS